MKTKNKPEFWVAGDIACCIIELQWETDPDDKPYYIRSHWVGYIGVPKVHPWYGKSYDELEHIDVHGGITFAWPERNNLEYNPERHEYLFSRKNEEFDHTYYNSLPKYIIKDESSDPYPYDTGLDLWWIGFDTAHYGDHDENGNCIRTREYVREQVGEMVRQASRALADRWKNDGEEIRG